MKTQHTYKAGDLVRIMKNAIDNKCICKGQVLKVAKPLFTIDRANYPFAGIRVQYESNGKTLSPRPIWIVDFDSIEPVSPANPEAQYPD